MAEHRTVTVDITADTTRFEAAMENLQRETNRVELSIIDLQDRRRVRMWDRAQVQALNFDEAMQSITDAIADALWSDSFRMSWVLGVGQDGLDKENTDDR